MLEKGDPTPQAQPHVQQWFDRLAFVIEEACALLRPVKPEKLALRSGCVLEEGGGFRLVFFGREYLVSGDDFAVRRAEDLRDVSPFTRSLILTYLATADGTTPSGRWVSFRDLPGGMFYAQAFQGYSGDRLVRELESAGDGAERFRRGAEAADGRPVDEPHTGYAFDVFPRVRLALFYWQGDEELPSQARVLFEDTAIHYMPIDGLAVLGSQLVDRVVRAAR